MALKKLKCVTSLEKFNQIGSLFFLHDQGHTAESSRSLLTSILNKDFEFDHIRVIYPQAPDITFQVAHGGLEQGLWYERNTLSPTAMERMDSIDHSCSLICHLIDQEKSRGIPMDRIVIGGFGMGGNLAMHIGFRYARKRVMIYRYNIRTQFWWHKIKTKWSIILTKHPQKT